MRGSGADPPEGLDIGVVVHVFQQTGRIRLSEPRRGAENPPNDVRALLGQAGKVRDSAALAAAWG